ncbi:MAG: hypothetical protein GY937_08710 [bacterium]|nr:hypothetical protein [bacterium]
MLVLRRLVARLVVVATAVLTLTGPPPACGAEPSFVWWEGEATAETNFPDTSWFAAETFPEKREEVLSAGDWLSASGDRGKDELFARYRVRVPQAGEYALWTRKFWKHGPFRWRFGKDAWQTCGRDIALADSTPIRTHLVANWVHLGRVELKAGTHTFELRLLAEEGEAATAGFDAFVLTPGVFVPRGRLQPGESSGRAPKGWWGVEPAPDAFTDDALLDLSQLNEDQAGKSGFVRREGASLVLGDGRPVRFWGVTVGPGIVRLDDGSVRYLARRLAKVGVNAVRIHGPIFDQSAADPTTVDAAYLERVHFFVAALKEEGIYTSLSFHFPLWFRIRPTYGIAGYGESKNKTPFGLLFFDPRMQQIHRAWARTLLTTRNPHTGIALGKDPAVASVEIQNEDSLLFWTFKPMETIPPAQTKVLEERFAAWLEERHGALKKALRRFGSASHERDDLRAARAGLLPIWNLTGRGHGEGDARRRASEQLRFLVELQRGYYERTVRYLREDLGVKSLVSCGNWHTADPPVLDALERYTYAAGDILDQHGYFGGRHEGEGASHSVRVGHTYSDRAAVLEPGQLPFVVTEFDGRPHIVSEIGWPSPNRFRAEFAPLLAAYGALQGVDGYFQFAVNGPAWGSASAKFAYSVPSVLGQSPAAALLFRRGDVAEAAGWVHHESVDLESQLDFRGTAGATAAQLDELRKRDVPAGAAGKAAPSNALDPLAPFVGRVVRKWAAKGVAALQSYDLPKYIDRKAERVRSLDGSLRWDYGVGFVTIDTARAQGITGFLAKAGRIELGDVVIESATEFGTILVISLDDEPLSSSKRVLVQTMTEERPSGWKVAAGGRITDLGGPPTLVRLLDAKVTLRGATRLRKATVLDVHGYARKGAVRRIRAGSTTIQLSPEALYTVLE